jgi:hypothetical protein
LERIRKEAVIAYFRNYPLIYLEALKDITGNLKGLVVAQVDSRTEYLLTRSIYNVTTTQSSSILRLFLQRKLQDKCNINEILSKFKITSQTEENYSCAPYRIVINITKFIFLFRLPCL